MSEEIVPTPKLLDIARDDDPCLKSIATEVQDIYHPDIQQLIVDMIATMKNAPGIGLAAPQVRVPLRIMVFYLPANRDDVNGVGVDLTVLINPIVTPLDEHNKVKDFEGCLSVPGMRGKVNRYYKIQYEGISEKGEKISRTAEGWHSRLVQHEYDHLNGVLYPELMEEEDKLLTVDQWRSLTQSN
jgi:peptide deformylase